tara:strand:- start:3059 stop:4060 length:1002 start_codon:yes stop_codon:yes gene_type:complete
MQAIEYNHFSSCIINYHYCYSNSLKIFKHLNGISPKRFNNQIKVLNKHCKMLTIQEILINNSSNIKRPIVGITFDDGTKDFIKNVYPILKRYNIKATLYISSLPYLEKKIMNVHKIHLIQAKLGINNFKNIFYEILDSYDAKSFVLDELPKLLKDKLYRYDNDHTRKFKTLLNYRLPYNILSEILTKIFKNIFHDKEEKIVDEFYLSIEDLKLLIDNQFEIGLHSHSHPVLSRLNYDDQYYEINTSYDFFKNNLKTDIFSFAYPYGHPQTYNKNTLKILKEFSNIYSAVTMNRDFVKKIDKNNTYEIPRFDNNDIFDKDSIFRANFKKIFEKK